MRKNTSVSPLGKKADKSKGKEENEIPKKPVKKMSNNPVENIAMHMCASIFMISTTKFVKGY